jgi:hypothetical protein
MHPLHSPFSYLSLPPALTYSVPHPKTNKLVINNLHLQTLNSSSIAPPFTRLHSFTLLPAVTLTNPNVFSCNYKLRDISTMQFWCLSNHSQPRWNFWTGATVHDQTWPCGFWQTPGIGQGSVHVLCQLHIRRYGLQVYWVESKLSVKIQNN